MNDISGKMAVVTGASSGIGKAVAIALARQGVHTALVGRSIERLEETAEAIRAIGSTKTVCCPADLAVESEAVKAIKFAASELGSLDYLLNCAGVSQRESTELEKITSSEYHRIMRTNVDSVLYCCREAFPYLKESDGAYIITILSTAAFSTGAGGGIYSASKYAARALHEAMELSCKGSNIKLSAISPGPVNTNIWSHKSEPVSEKRKEKMLLAENIADIAIFLLTQDPNVHIGNIIVQPWFYTKN